MKTFKAETAMNFNILKGINNKLNKNCILISPTLGIRRFLLMLSLPGIRFSVLFNSVAEHGSGNNSLEFIVFNFDVEIVHSSRPSDYS